MCFDKRDVPMTTGQSAFMPAGAAERIRLIVASNTPWRRATTSRHLPRRGKIAGTTFGARATGIKVAC